VFYDKAVGLRSPSSNIPFTRTFYISFPKITLFSPREPRLPSTRPLQCTYLSIIYRFNLLGRFGIRLVLSECGANAFWCPEFQG